MDGEAQAGFSDGQPVAEELNKGLIALIVIVATIGGFMFGYDSGVINGTQDGLKAAFDLSDWWLGFAVAALLPGCAIGAFLAGRLADTMGRRNVMMLSAFTFVLSALVAGAAPTDWVFIGSRFVAGLAVGAASVLAPVYISEVTPAAVRGRLASIQQIMIISGLTGAFVVNYWLANTAGHSTATFWLGYPAWRWMFWAQVLPAGIYLLTLLLIPDSPRFLVMRGRDAEAESVLARILGPAAAKVKAAEIRSSLAGDHHRPRLSDLLDKQTGRVRKIVWAGIGIAMLQQFVGINIVFYYGSVLWQSVGFSESDSLLINILSGSLSILACIVTVFTIDKIGRKPLLLIGSAGMTVTLAVVAIMFSTGTFTDGTLHLSDQNGLIALIAANLYVIFFNVSWGPVMWVMLGEMFPNQIRGSGLAVSGFAQWGANFAISVSFPAMAAGVGLPVTYGLYAAAAFISFFFVKAMVHETRGRELEDMEG
ncbi:sugar porter family MFS transporter [Stakelama sediminis]|uniref:SP family sugar:H+ symporter-like MFS transporter n=1 Tax=Stakelama sediminis TaxID=463200 RepID=A0A840Z1U6_9SPHN|nr:sugar porter family MFS transporter [Stakelama sediminis]MBB5719714.1 SP family sugar:H+ symporter-like MFS transporter [Stakelama sediminis]